MKISNTMLYVRLEMSTARALPLKREVTLNNGQCQLHHHHHHRPSLLLEHRPPTMVRQRALSWAALSISLQVWPVFVKSASKSRRQVFLGLPLFRFPCGFHFSACLVMLFAGFLRVCPIHPHLLRRISSSTGIWLVRCHRSACQLT